jgi:hypothetical protein
MPTNIEIKAVLKNRNAVEGIAAHLSDVGPETIPQEDFFFGCDRARLKLRVFTPDRGELICYERANVADVRGSHYLIARTPDPQILYDILAATLGVTGVVKNTDFIYDRPDASTHRRRVWTRGVSGTRSCPPTGTK